MHRIRGRVVLGVLLYPVLQAQPPSSYTISTFAGTNFVGDGGPAIKAQLSAVEGLATDSAGNLYIADNTDHRIRRVSTSGVISTLAGTGNAGYSGDGAPGVNATLNSPYGIAIDKDGKVFIADYGNGRIRCVTRDGMIKTVAGGSEVRFIGARNVAVDGSGFLYVSDYADHRVYRISPSGQTAAIAGTGSGGFNGDGPALSATLNFPTGLAVDRSGAVFIADSGNKLVRKVAAGQITTVAGAAAGNITLYGPTGVALDSIGNLYIADSLQNRLYRRTSDGLFSVLAGSVTPLTGPMRDVAVDPFGNIFLSDGRRVLRVSSTGPPAPVAGDGTYGAALDGVDATLAYLNGPIGVSSDDLGNVYVVEERARRVRKISGGLIRTATTEVSDPVSVAADSFGGLRIADYQGNRVRGMTSLGTLYTLAGDGEPGFAGDGQHATSSRLNRPRSLAMDREGNLYIADSLNHRIRKVGVNGMIATVAGTGVRGYYGDGGLAVEAHLNAPLGVSADAAGNLYIADSGNNAIRRVNSSGVISTVAGTGSRGYSGDGGPAALATLNVPAAAAADAQGIIFIADTYNQRIRRVTLDGNISTVAGDGFEGLSGDGGPALGARFRNPTALAFDASGFLYVADLDNNRIRRLAPGPSAPIVAPLEQLSDLIVMNAASYRSGPIAPGEIVSLFGAGIGPETASGGRLNAIGALDASVADTQVRFDSRPAPLFYMQRDQINVQVPYAVDRETLIEVFYQGKLRARAKAPVALASPGIFTLQRGVGQAIAIHPDGSLNSTANPADRGSIVTLFATGEGLTDPQPRDGMPADAPFPRPILPISVQVGSAPAEILYAAAAPGFVGLMQLNVKLPGIFTPPGIRPLTLVIGDVFSQPGVTISVQ